MNVKELTKKIIAIFPKSTEADFEKIKWLIANAAMIDAKELHDIYEQKNNDLIEKNQELRQKIASLKCCGNCEIRIIEELSSFNSVESCNVGNNNSSNCLCEKWRFDKLTPKERMVK